MLSTEIRQRLAGLTAEIAAKTARLGTINEEKLITISTDEKRLIALEQEESELPILITRLEHRRVLLGRELEQALQTEAVTRVGEIETEQASIASRIAKRREAFLSKINELLELIRADYPDRVHKSELDAEAQYLVEAFNTPWPQTPATTALNDNDLNTLRAEFAKRYQLLFAGHEWRERRDAIRQQKNAIAVAEADQQRAATSRRMVKSNVPANAS
jgi:hypothetical protein